MRVLTGVPGCYNGVLSNMQDVYRIVQDTDCTNPSQKPAAPKEESRRAEAHAWLYSAYLWSLYDHRRANENPRVPEVKAPVLVRSMPMLGESVHVHDETTDARGRPVVLEGNRGMWECAECKHLRDEHLLLGLSLVRCDWHTYAGVRCQCPQYVPHYNPERSH